MKKCLLSLFVVLSLFAAQVFAQVPAITDDPPCDPNNAMTAVRGGSFEPFGVYVAYYCAPRDRYSDPSLSLVVYRPDLLTEETTTALRTAFITGTFAGMAERRTHNVWSPELAPVWQHDMHKIRAAFPGPTWRVQANGTAATRPAYVLTDAGTLGERDAVPAAIGSACLCSDPENRYETTASMYCAFRAATPPNRFKPRVVALCSRVR